MCSIWIPSPWPVPAVPLCAPSNIRICFWQGWARSWRQNRVTAALLRLPVTHRSSCCLQTPWQHSSTAANIAALSLLPLNRSHTFRGISWWRNQRHIPEFISNLAVFQSFQILIPCSSVTNYCDISATLAAPEHMINTVLNLHWEVTEEQNEKPSTEF